MLPDHCMGLFHSYEYSIIVQRKIEIFLEKIAMLKKLFGMLRTKMEGKSAPMGK